MMQEVLKRFGINNASISPFGSGLIHATFLVEDAGVKSILQEINTYVFTDPEAIVHNIECCDAYLSVHHPSYQFPGILKTMDGKSLVYENDKCYRLSKFIDNSYTVNKIENAKDAYNAAGAFSLLTKNLQGLNARLLKDTIPDFHNIEFRFRQFTESIKNAIPARETIAKDLINKLLSRKNIVEVFSTIKQDKEYPIRIMHHDTKINNVLFDKEHGHAKAVCDLDTLMQGRIISDIGDMVRTSACSENEEHLVYKDVYLKKNLLEGIYEGYLSNMNAHLTVSEKKYLWYAGPYLIYMQAIRFLSDYLVGDPYYGSKYEDHNLNRAYNQWALLESFSEVESEINKNIKQLVA